MLKVQYYGYTAVKFDRLFKVVDHTGKEVFSTTFKTDDVTEEEIMDFLIGFKQIKESGE